MCLNISIFYGLMFRFEEELSGEGHTRGPGQGQMFSARAFGRGRQHRKLL